MSDAVSAGPSTASLASFAQASTAPTDVSFDFLARRPQLSQSPKVNGGSPVAGSKHDGFATPQRRGTRDRKRPRLASETDGVESVDYWIQFDDDEPDNMLGQSFEIDYSKRRNNLSSLNQYASYLWGSTSTRRPFASCRTDPTQNPERHQHRRNDPSTRH